MTKPDLTKREMPAAFYAAAGASDLAYERLRKLPEAASRTWRVATEAAGTLRERVATGDSRLNRDRLAADLAKLRESTQKGATALVASASVAQEKAAARYRDLVARGEQVVAARNEGATWPAATETAEPAELTAGSGDTEPTGTPNA